MKISKIALAAALIAGSASAGCPSGGFYAGLNLGAAFTKTSFSNEPARDDLDKVITLPGTAGDALRWVDYGADTKDGEYGFVLNKGVKLSGETKDVLSAVDGKSTGNFSNRKKTKFTLDAIVGYDWILQESGLVFGIETGVGFTFGKLKLYNTQNLKKNDSASVHITSLIVSPDLTKAPGPQEEGGLIATNDPLLEIKESFNIPLTLKVGFMVTEDFQLALKAGGNIVKMSAKPVGKAGELKLDKSNRTRFVPTVGLEGKYFFTPTVAGTLGVTYQFKTKFFKATDNKLAPLALGDIKYSAWTVKAGVVFHF